MRWRPGVFPSEEILLVFQAILDRVPVSPLRLNAEVPPKLDEIITKALEKDRKLRYQSASEMRADLQRLKRDTDTARVASSGRVVAAPSATQAQLGWRSKTALAAGEFSLALLLALAAWLIVFRRDGGTIDSLAVLPFVNANADPNTEYLSDGITESLINNLSQLLNLRVMARSTVFRYKGKDADPQKVARELHVRAILSGKLLQRGDTLVLQTELVDAEKGSQLWGDKYNRKLADILTVQDEIAREISDKLRFRLSGEEKSRMAKRHTDNPEAYQLYLQSRYHWNKRTPESLRKAIAYFEKAIERDPAYALAHAGLADCYVVWGSWSVLPPREGIPRAKAETMRALALDDMLAEAHTTLATIEFAFDLDFVGAEKEHKRALELNPNYPTNHQWYAEYLAQMGRFDEAQAEIRLAQTLDPFSLIINGDAGFICYLSRQYDLAIHQLERTLEMDPNFVPTLVNLGFVYDQKGMYKEAIAAFQKAVQLSGRRPDDLAALAYGYALAGNRAEAAKILEELEARYTKEDVSAEGIGLALAALGKKDEAFAWIEKAWEQGLPPVDLKVEPQYDPLRSDARNVALLRRVGLPP